MNTVVSIEQFNVANTLATSNLSIKENEGDVSFGKLRKGTLDGTMVFSTALEKIKGVQDIRDVAVGDEFYEVHIELDGVTGCFYSERKETCVQLARRLAVTMYARAYLHYHSAVLTVVNEIGKVTKSIKYSDVFVDADPELDDHLNFHDK